MDPKIERQFNDISEMLNAIGGRKMEKPRMAGIETLIREEMRQQHFWTDIKDAVDVWIKDKEARIEFRLRNSEAMIEKLKAERIVLAREVVRLRAINSRIGELLGIRKIEPKR